MSDAPSDGLGKYIAIASGIIGLVITVNSAVTGYFKDRADEYDHFRSEVAGEEDVWKSLYSDYLTVYSSDYANNPMARQNKVVALYSLAQRDVPSFDEFERVSAKAKLRAACRLTQLQSALLNSLDEEGKRENIEVILRSRRGQPLQADACLVPASVSAVTVPVTPARSASTQEPANSSSAASQEESLPVTLELAPTSATGWDVDMFWCSGRNGSANFDHAKTFGTAAAASANSGRAIAPGVSLGRVRVRAISRSQVHGPQNPQFIAFDEGPGEPEAAQALQNLLNTDHGSFALAKQTGGRTAWYLSAVICT